MRIYTILFTIIFIFGCTSKPEYENIEYSSLYDGFTKETLENGLTVLIKEDYRSPLVTMRCFVRSGSIHEGKYLGSGISHYIEHTVFKGTPSRPGESAITYETEMLGADNLNAHTSLTHTAYHFTISSNNYKNGLDILSDMMKNASFPARAIETEKQVILSEMAMGEDNPYRVFSKFFMDSFFSVHPYRYPVIGYKSLFESLTREDLLSFYAQRNVANNMILVVVGAVSKDDLLNEIKKTFGSMKRKSLSPVYIPKEPSHLKRREFRQYSTKTKQTMVRLAFQTVDLFSDDMYALDVLASILSQPETGILSKVFINKKKIAFEASAFSWTPKTTKGMFVFDAVLQNDSSVEDFEKEVYNLIKKIKNGAINQNDIDESVSHTIASFVKDKETIESLADSVGYNEMSLGDYTYDIEYHNRLKKVTINDIERVAKKYLKKGTETLVVFAPEETRPESEGKTQNAISNEVYTFTLPGGLKVVYAKKEIPTTSFVVLGTGGLLFENETNNGIFSVFINSLILGGGKYKKEKLYKTLNKKGASLSAYSTDNNFSIRMKTLKNDSSLAIDILSTILTKPQFNSNDIENVKRNLYNRLAAQEQNISGKSAVVFNEYFYGKHPYALNPIGNSNAIASITKEDLLKLKKEFLVSKNLVLSIVGGEDFQFISNEIHKRFMSIPHAESPKSDKWELPEIEKDIDNVDYMESRNTTYLRIGYRGPSLYTDVDYYPTQLMIEIFDGMGGVLFQKIRNLNSHAYAVGAYQNPKYKSGSIIFYAVVDSKRRSRVHPSRIIKDEIYLMNKELNYVSYRDLARAKSIAKTRVDRILQDPFSEALSLGLRALYDIEPRQLYSVKERYEEVDRIDILRVAEKYLNKPSVESIMTQN